MACGAGPVRRKMGKRMCSPVTNQEAKWLVVMLAGGVYKNALL